MAVTLPSGTLSALNAGDIIDRGLIRFDLGGGSYGFWTGVGPLVFGGLTYQGAGSLIQISAFPSTTSGGAISVEARLNSMPDSGLSPDVLSSIFAQDYNQRPVTIYTAYFNATTRALLSVETEYAGYIDKITQDETIGGEAVLVAQFESRARDFTRIGYRKRSDADQRRIDANDGGLRHVAVAATQKIYWGRNGPNGSAPRRN
jgi:hypothetical protein